MTHNRRRRTPALAAGTPTFFVIRTEYPRVRYPAREEVIVRNKHVDAVDLTINGSVDETLEPGDVYHATAEELGAPIRSYHVQSPTAISGSDQGDLIIIEKGGLTEEVRP